MAIYREIQNYVKNKHGFVVKTCWIASMKENCGIPVRVAANRYCIDSRVYPCPPEKQSAILEAFQHFGMLS